MKKLLSIFMIVSMLLFTSCSEEEPNYVTQSTPQIEVPMNLHIEYSEPVLFAYLYAFDETNYCLYTLEYKNVIEINKPISEGVKFKLRTFDDNPINYEYTLYNSDTTIQFEGTQSGGLDTTLWRTYILQ